MVLNKHYIKDNKIMKVTVFCMDRNTTFVHRNYIGRGFVHPNQPSSLPVHLTDLKDLYGGFRLT